MIRIIEIAEKCGKKIVIEGRSIKTNLEIAEKMGLLKIDKGTVIPAQDIGNYPPDKIVILTTGAQGEEFSCTDAHCNKATQIYHLEMPEIPSFYLLQSSRAMRLRCRS
jgi:mRNA degradation ribonuclease J1/J2